MSLIDLFLLSLKYKKKLQKSINNLFLTYKKIRLIYNKYNFIIQKIITISINFSNSFLVVQDFNGKKNFCYSIKKLDNKFKNLNNQILKYYYKILILKLKLIKIPLALHLYNTSTMNYSWFLEKLAKKNFIVIVKFFKRFAYNGCRKKKLK